MNARTLTPSVSAARPHSASCSTAAARPASDAVGPSASRLEASRLAASRPATPLPSSSSTERWTDLARLAKDAVLETLWPTRCCVCDEPGTVLCDRCRSALSYVDRWQACPHCGAPFGRLLCTECNGMALAALGRERYPFASCSSAVVLDHAARRIVLSWKDGSELRLGAEIAAIMANMLPPSWKRASDASPLPESKAGFPPYGALAPRAIPGSKISALERTPEAVFFVPASRRARTRRGYDHAQLLAEELARLLGLPAWTPLARPSTQDQRALGRRDRARNAAKAFHIELPERTWRPDRKRELSPPLPRCILLADDVFTTGSTLSAAVDALKAAGVETVHCVTFARAF